MRQGKRGRDDAVSLTPGHTREIPIVAIGASAGGLDAMARLLDVLPSDTGMAFILVQHLDPSHESLLVELLAPHTRMAVSQAAEGMLVEPGRVYVCPPGHFLAVRFGTLHLSLPHPDHGARLPIDFLVRSLTERDAVRSICIILSGTGADGSGGIAQLKQQGGHIIAQDPDEAEYDGMPRCAIRTGAVDAIVPIAGMPAELARFGRLIAGARQDASAGKAVEDDTDILAIIAVLQQKTSQNFSAYKPGTLKRRIQRRMGLSGVPEGDYRRYLRNLENNIEECRELAQDLLINVTSFFRDPEVFDLLERQIVPSLIEALPIDRALRVWVAGCSTGEEAYSIAMICRDAILAAQRDIPLQIFASDMDAQAIAVAREGIYPLSIKDDVPADRLARYFIVEEDHYRVTPALRGSVVFTVQDVLRDPPFSHIDLVSCRNLLIYLKPGAQAKVISLFHFALRERGILLLGSAETPGRADEHFETVHKAERIYRHIAQSRAGEPGFPLSFAESIPRLTGQDRGQQLSRQIVLAELCRDLVVDDFAPASVLINANHQCLYSLGPVSRFLRVASGPPTLDLLAMAPPDLRATLRYAIGKADSGSPRFQTRVCHTLFDGQELSFTVKVRFLTSENEELRLVSFVDESAYPPAGDAAFDEVGKAQIYQLERELEAAHAELQRAVQSRDALVHEQKAINDEAMSVNEEFQSTNEELLTSKEELQSLNEELIALNGQLQETLDRQRVASDDLQNVLYSTKVATLFLDPALCIRFFTPATRAIFNVIPGDLGRPLSDLHSLASDDSLLDDARIVLKQRNTIEREVGAPEDRWFLRRIFPYRTHDDRIEGVVITFIDITDRRRTAEALERAKHEAEQSSHAKSRFLAVASHDLRQPLQSLKLIGELLRKSTGDMPTRELMARLDQSLESMSDMLDTLLDINQIEAGVVQTRCCAFPVAAVFERLGAEFSALAKAQGLDLRIVSGTAIVNSDPALLEVMLRNLLANALKYTRKGKVLLGCRHEGETVRLEVWDTGIGIEPDQLPRIFDEFYQVSNPARERGRGFGLGLAIVWQLGQLLGHAVGVRSWPGKGSVFSIAVPLAARDALPIAGNIAAAQSASLADTPSCAIFVVEDDPDVMELLDRLLTGTGHSVTVAQDGPTALDLVGEGAIRPEIVLTDYNLPGGMNGLEVLAGIRTRLKEDIPGIILTGDISKDTLAEIERADCIGLSKPVSPSVLYAAIGKLAPSALRKGANTPAAGAEAGHRPKIICVVEDNHAMRDAIRSVLEHDDRSVGVYPSAETFLADHVADRDLCLLVDATLPGMDGIALIEHLRRQGDPLPAILITGDGDIGLAVQAMRSGANDFIERPVSRAKLIDSIDRAIAQGTARQTQDKASRETAARLATLTARQKTVLDLVLAGHPSKNIAADLGISQRTIESHRAEIMHKLGVRTIPDLVRLVLSAP